MAQTPPPTQGLTLQQKPQLTQRLIMSAHMQQAIQLLQVPIQELEPFIEEQISQNPLLEIVDEGSNKEEKLKEELNIAENEDKDAANEEEIVINEQDFTLLRQLDDEYGDYSTENSGIQPKRSLEDDKSKAYFENSICASESLYALLIHQAHEYFNDLQDLQAAEIIIGYLDENGFLTTPLQEIALLHELNETRLQTVLQQIQQFEPYGIGASSIHDSLLIQLRCRKKEHTLAYKIVDTHYEDLLHNKIPVIQKKLKCSLEDIHAAIEKDISTLNIHPGVDLSSQKTQAIIPDVTLRIDKDQLVVDVNKEFVPRLRMNRKYLKMLDDPDVSVETKNFIRRHVFSAKWLARNLHQRYTTIERIADSLAKRQKDFFLEPQGKLIPLTMKAVAEELEVHESTIARTVSNKYIDTPRGLMPLRALFTTEMISDEGESLSSKTIQEALLDIINAEDKEHPLSDDKISSMLKSKGIVCARRTVAKYRSLLNIANTQQRRKYSKN